MTTLNSAKGSPTPQSIAARIVTAAHEAQKAAAGKKYTPAGNDPDTGFDCSGYVLYVLRRAIGDEFPKHDMTARQIAALALFEEIETPEAGALIFFPGMKDDSRKDNDFDHIGIVIDEANWIGSQSRTGVKKVLINHPYYWGPRQKKILRYIGTKTAHIPYLIYRSMLSAGGKQNTAAGITFLDRQRAARS